MGCVCGGGVTVCYASFKPSDPIGVVTTLKVGNLAADGHSRPPRPRFAGKAPWEFLSTTPQRTFNWLHVVAHTAYARRQRLRLRYLDRLDCVVFPPPTPHHLTPEGNLLARKPRFDSFCAGEPPPPRHLSTGEVSRRANPTQLLG